MLVARPILIGHQALAPLFLAAPGRREGFDTIVHRARFPRYLSRVIGHGPRLGTLRLLRRRHFSHMTAMTRHGAADMAISLAAHYALPKKTAEGPMTGSQYTTLSPTYGRALDVVTRGDFARVKPRSAAR